MRIAGRPFGIVALALLATLTGAWSLAAAAGLLPTDVYQVGSHLLPPEAPRIASAAWGALLLLSAFLLLLLRRRGWELLMIATGVGLFGAIWQWAIGNQEPVRMGLLVVTAFYLNGREVRHVFLGAAERTAPVPLAPQEAAVDGAG